jgi:hypothetical protein
MRNVTIRQALQRVADTPVMQSDVLLNIPTHELVARTLFEIANNPQFDQRGSMARANLARNMILSRLVGRRRPGSHPATDEKVVLEMIDLAAGEISE